MTVDKRRRRQRILELLSKRRVRNQQQLQQLLRTDAIIATQATLSRDLRDLGVWKGPDGYVLPGAAHRSDHDLRDLAHAIEADLLSIERGGNMVILHTSPGHAQALAFQVDRAQLREVLGTIAGDDTVFVATRSPAEASRLVRLFKELAGLAEGIADSSLMRSLNGRARSV